MGRRDLRLAHRRCKKRTRKRRATRARKQPMHALMTTPIGIFGEPEAAAAAVVVVGVWEGTEVGGEREEENWVIGRLVLMWVSTARLVMGGTSAVLTVVAELTTPLMPVGTGVGSGSCRTGSRGYMLLMSRKKRAGGVK
jgi:hypothetical protein